MKRIIVIGFIVVALIALIVFNKMTSKNNVANIYAVVKKGQFEIIVANSGELIAEKSIDIQGPSIGQAIEKAGNQRGGSSIRGEDIKILDLVPEGTIVGKGDYVAQLDKSSYSNILKSELDNLEKLQTDLQMQILDTAVKLTNLRDDIRNQISVVEEVAIILAQSKFEPPATIRQAEQNLNKAQRVLEQKKRSYGLILARNQRDINNQQRILAKQTVYVNDLQEFLSKLTITAPSDGMVTYKKNKDGSKRKIGSGVAPFNETVALLPDLSSLISIMYVNEIEISKVKTGQRVDIIIDAFPKKAFTGKVFSIANIGQQLPNSDAKMFEVQIKIVDSDPALRPSMTTSNKIIIKTFIDAVFIPLECVQTGPDSIPFVYTKNRTKQIVVPGESNDKNIIIEQGLEPDTYVYTETPVQPEKFKLVGEKLIPLIKKYK